MAMLGGYLLLRHRTYFLRCRLPADLAGLTRRRELVRSLRTKQLPVARLRAARLAMRLGELWTSLRVTDARHDELIDAWFNQAVKEAYKPLGDRSFGKGVIDPSAEDAWEQTRQLYYDDAWQSLHSRRNEFKSGDFSYAVSVTREILKGCNPPIGPGDQAFDMACKRVMVALGNILEARMRWAEGDVDFVPSRAPPADETNFQPGPKPPSDTRTLAEAIQVFIDLKKRERPLTSKQVTQLTGELKVLTEAFGPETRVSAITPKEAGQVYEGLRFLPKGFRSHPSLSGLWFGDMVSKARADGLKPLDPKTINGYLGTIRSLFDHEVRTGHAHKNPFAGLSVKVPHSVTGERDFEDDELEAVFSHPIFRGYAGPNRASQPGDLRCADWRFWAPLIALHTGARISEIAQLTPGDIREEDGVWVIDINASGGKRLKVLTTKRIVPIHSSLVELGFIDMSQDRRANAKALLLPNIPKPVGGDPGKQPGQWFREKLLEQALGKARRKGLGFHSFRHHMETMLRDAHVNSVMADRLLGHQSPGVGAGYGRTNLTALKESVEKVVLPPAVARISPPGW